MLRHLDTGILERVQIWEIVYFLIRSTEKLFYVLSLLKALLCNSSENAIMCLVLVGQTFSSLPF